MMRPLSLVSRLPSPYTLPTLCDPDGVIVPYRLPNCRWIRRKMTVGWIRLKEPLVPIRSV